LFKDFSIDIEPTSRFTIKALKLRQKDKVMYVGKIHPGLLLKIAYVVRRASERKFAYQRMLSKDRIAALGEFISSDESQNFLPNTVLIVFDPNMRVRYDAKKQELTAPLVYCSAWIIDGQHRVYGFLGTKYEDWTEEEFEPFDLPLIVVRDLPEADQTRTFININYFQKRIKAGLLCDLSTLTRDLRQKLTWASLIGRELNFAANSPLKDRIKISELHGGRSIGLSSLAQFALLETLLGYRQKSKLYSGPLFEYAPFDRTLPFDSAANQAAFHRQLQLLIRFLVGVRKNTASDDPGTDPWRNTSDYALLRPTGINALFMLLSKILVKHPDGGLDFGDFLSSLNTVSFKRDSIAKQGGGWKGFRNVANLLIRKINKGKSKRNKLSRFGTKEKA
jgi:DGQHR domain-containing protein